MKKLVLTLLLTLGVTTMIQAKEMSVLYELEYSTDVWIHGSGEDTSEGDEDYSEENDHANYAKIFCSKSITTDARAAINGASYVYIGVYANQTDYDPDDAEKYYESIAFQIQYATLYVKCTINGVEYPVQSITGFEEGDLTNWKRFNFPKVIDSNDKIKIEAEFGGWDSTDDYKQIAKVTGMEFYGVKPIYQIVPKISGSCGSESNAVIYGKGEYQEDGEYYSEKMHFSTILSSCMLGSDWGTAVTDAKVIGITFRFNDELSNVNENSVRSATLYLRESEDTNDDECVQFGYDITNSKYKKANAMRFEWPTQTIYYEIDDNSPILNTTGGAGFNLEAAFASFGYSAEVAEVIGINFYKEEPIDPGNTRSIGLPFKACLTLTPNGWVPNYSGEDCYEEVDGYGTFALEAPLGGSHPVTEDLLVLCLDIKDMYIYYPNISLRLDDIIVDGESFPYDKSKILIGELEQNSGNWRIEMYNIYGNTTYHSTGSVGDGGVYDESLSPFNPADMIGEESIKIVFTIEGGGLPKSETGIEEIKADEKPVEVVGIYNLAGQKLSGEQRGINIISYSDGSAKKVLVK